MPSLGLDLLFSLGLIIVGYASYRAKATDVSGSLAAMLIGIIIGFTAGWLWVIYILVFLVAGSLATHFRYNEKAKLGAAEEKGGRRGVSNVLANGSIALLLAILYWATKDWYITGMFVAAVASPAADTMATEFGLLSKTSPRMITDFTPTQPGRSGGITLLGSLVALATSVIFGILAILMGITDLSLAAIGIIGGFVGVFLDSFLGATLQSLYQCYVCQRYTEKKLHCNKPTKRIHGYSLIDNNIVNLLAGVGAVSSVILLEIFLF
ncbi:MAG: DUF92 domain-containing protein [Conexivisphaerales archaeon]